MTGPAMNQAYLPEAWQPQQPDALAPREDKEGLRYYPYPPTGERLDSVTAAIDGTNAKPWLNKWHGKKATTWCVDNLDELARVLAEQGRDAAIALGEDQGERLREVKADCGTYVHAVQKALILWAARGTGGVATAIPPLPDHLQGALYELPNGESAPVEKVCGWMIDGFINFVSDMSPEFEAAEMKVYNQPLGIAGTLDMIIRLRGYGISADGTRVVERKGGVLTLCVDTKTGRSMEGTWREQLAAYRRMTECLLPLGEMALMPRVTAGAVLHLRPETEYPGCYSLMLVSAGDEETAWRRFQKVASAYRERRIVAGKPGKVIRALLPDGTLPGPRLCDLLGEGHGRAISPLIKHLGNSCELELIAQMTPAELLSIKGVGKVLSGHIVRLLGENNLTLAAPAREVA